MTTQTRPKPLAFPGGERDVMAYHRDGFVVGEGAGVLVLEELEFAKKRGAEVVLAGESYDEAYLAALGIEKKLKLNFVHPYDDPDVIAKVSRGLGEAMVGINVADIPVPHRLADRGW